MIEITIKISHEEFRKLNELAKYRKCTVEQCIRRFAESCQPGGSGTVPFGEPVPNMEGDKEKGD